MDSSSTRGLGFWTGATLGVFLTAAAFFLFTEHRAHLFGAIPYVLVILCLVVIWAFLRSRRSQKEDKP